MGLIEADDVTFEYIRRDENNEVTGITTAVDHVSLSVEKGQFIAILGSNGSGKSTFAKHLNAILHPTEGTIYVGGMDTKLERHELTIRSHVGMVFQNPDNQIIANVVDEEVAFGPENLGIKNPELKERVVNALKSVGMMKFVKYDPGKLSGGQKQRIAIAGVLAMKPECIILDEPTAMLDPLGRKEVVDTLLQLNREEHVTVILITHNMKEVLEADYIYVMDKGKVCMEGDPHSIFAREEELRALRLDVPIQTQIAHRLGERGLIIPQNIIRTDELVRAVLAGDRSRLRISRHINDVSKPEKKAKPKLIVSHLKHVYEPGTANERIALDDINLVINEGDFIGLIGHTGSGKSTLIQHLNGLIAPTQGDIFFDGKSITEKGYNKVALRGKVGLVFQYPEYQLFEETVFKDVCFGPANLGLSKSEVELRAYEALRSVGFSDELFYQSPFDLSGGQKRRVAIAGVLAMKPEVLILDEPTAGLDPKGRDEILDLIRSMHDNLNMTVILVSHSMEDVSRYADRLLVMNDGRLLYDATPLEVYSVYRELEKIGLAAPDTVYILNELRNAGLRLDPSQLTVESACDEIVNALAGGTVC